MRIGSLILLIWLIIGAVAGGQRGYYSGSIASCTKAGIPGFRQNAARLARYVAQKISVHLPTAGLVAGRGGFCRDHV
jgi:hypothetical protein